MLNREDAILAVKKLDEQAVAKYNSGTPGDYYDRKDFIRQAVVGMLAETSWSDDARYYLRRILDYATYVGD